VSCLSDCSTADVLCLAETWNDADSVSILIVSSSGFDHIVDCPRPRPFATAESLTVNHGGVAVIVAGGARLSVVPVDAFNRTLSSSCVFVSSSTTTSALSSLPSRLGIGAVSVFR